MNSFQKIFKNIAQNKTQLWTIIWVTSLLLLWLWDLIFLNVPALKKLETAFVNTFFIGLIVVIFSLVLSWLSTMLIHYSRDHIKGILFFKPRHYHEAFGPKSGSKRPGGLIEDPRGLQA